MNNQKWLKRKYPKSFDKINEVFTAEYIEMLKNGRYNLGKLIINKNIGVFDDYFYQIGTYIIFKRSNPVNSYNYPMHYAITKCTKDGYTESGYQSIDIFEKEFEELFE